MSATPDDVAFAAPPPSAAPTLATRVLRRAAREGRRIALAWRPHAIVLLYHRVAAPGPDPFGLSVRPDRFAEHMEVVRRFGPCLTFGALARRLRAGDAPRRMIAVTFDDGYRDNLETAAPILRRAGVPATVFVVAGATGAGRQFWWDLPARVFLSPGTLPETLELRSGDEVRRWSLADARTLTASEAATPWDARREPPRNARQKLFLDVWAFLAGRTPSETERLADAVAAWAGASRADHPEDHPVTADELRRLADADGVEIGGHTLSHPRLTALPPERRLEEMREGRRALGAILGREPDCLAYPFGDHCGETARLAREAGFEAACTTAPRLASPRSDPMRIPRVTVDDCDGDPLARRLRRLTLF